MESLRHTFDQAAELYDRARPGYPAALFGDLAELGCVGAHCRVLEIGCGTGQATLPLARLGCQIVCVELGANMAAVARRKLAPFPLVRVEVAAFEDWTLPTEPFDMVFAATAFHWIDPSIRVKKAAEALRPEGVLATIATHHIAGGTEPFFVEAQACYERWDPSTPPGTRLAPATEIPFDDRELEQSGLFAALVFRRYEWELAYETHEYIDTLLTYSGHRALAADARQGLIGCIAELITSRYGGRIRKRYMSELRVARTRSAMRLEAGSR